MTHITIRVPVGIDKKQLLYKFKQVAKSKKTTTNKMLINYILKQTK
jgi:hypothetical protein